MPVRCLFRPRGPEPARHARADVRACAPSTLFVMAARAAEGVFVMAAAEGTGYVHTEECPRSHAHACACMRAGLGQRG
eukprot:3847937-Pleurochrysis_carterae.AAC.1